MSPAKMKAGFLAILLLLSAGCGANRQSEVIPSYKYIVGVSQANLIEPWRIALYEEMKAQGALCGDMRLVFTDAAGDSKKQIDDVEHLLGLGIDLLIISPNNENNLRETIGTVNQSIPVILLDRDVADGDYNLYVGSDNALIGTLAGEYAATLLGDRGGTVLEITGNQDSPPAQALSQGFAKALEGYPEIRIINTIDGDWLRDTAEMRMKDYLIKSDKVDIVFAHNDAMAYGAYIAATDLRIDGIRFIGVDGLESEGKALVEQGILAGTFYRHTGGKEAVEWALKILEGEKKIPLEVVLEPIPIVAE